MAQLGAFIYRRPEQTGRKIRRLLQREGAVEALGTLEPGCEVYGLTRGYFSLIDLILAILDQTGPADLTISTWTAAKVEIDHAYRLLSEGRVRSVRFLVDFSFPSRQPGYCAALRERFGDDVIRVTKNHAKFVVIWSPPWHLVVRTSMNLNENQRLENFEISDDQGMARFLLDVVDELFRLQSAGEGFERRPSDVVDEFHRWNDVQDTGADLSSLGVALDDPAWWER